MEITLLNDVLESLGSYAGIYKQSSIVKEYPRFQKEDGKAIWYNVQSNKWPSQSDRWMIGPQGNIGQYVGSDFYTKNKHGGLTHKENVWKYWNGKKFKTAGPNDIVINCLPDSKYCQFGCFKLRFFRIANRINKYFQCK